MKFQNIREARDAIVALASERKRCRTPHEELALVILSGIAERISAGEVRKVYPYLREDTKPFVGIASEEQARMTLQLREELEVLKHGIGEIRSREAQAVAWFLEQIESGLVLQSLHHLEHVYAYICTDCIELHIESLAELKPKK